MCHISHSEYVICRYGLHLMTGGEDRVLVKTIGWPIDCLCTVSYGMEISFVMGNFIGIVDTRIARASLEVPSVHFESRTDLNGLYV